MERMWKLAIVAVLFSGCSNLVKRGAAEVATAPWDVDEEAPESVRQPVDLTRPEPVDCGEPSLIGAPDLQNDRRENPTITETFGADGCIDERWIHAWDGELMLEEVYDFFDPEVPQQSYLNIFPYTHRWQYDPAARVVAQERSRPGEPAPFFTETVRYDSAGRLVERTSASNPHDVFNDGVVRRELWTFDGARTEFTVHSVIHGDVEVSRERREFEHDQIAREYALGSDGEERLMVARQFDAQGRVVEVEAWEFGRSEPRTHAWIERRPDGTMLRRTQKNLALGWFDVFEYDAAERLTLHTQDETDDGSIEFREIKRYDDAGNPVFESTEYDFDQPRSTYSEIRRTFDERGRLVESFDTPVWLRGKSQRVRYSYDDSGPGFSTLAERLDANGQVTGTTAITRWLAPNQIAEQRSDSDHDGIPETHELRLWNGEEPVERLFDREGDGVFDVVEQWQYDRAGQLVDYAMDADGDGSVDARVIYQR